MFLAILQIELPNCYSSASIQYNENLKTATVSLNSNEIEECNLFTYEVMLNLSFNNKWVPQQYVINTYNYSNINQIVMERITIANGTADNTGLPTYAKLNISNLAFWTEVRVVFLGRQTSQMDKCFDGEISSFELTRTQFEFEVYLTTACEKEISIDAVQFQYQFNQKADTIQIIRQNTTDPDQKSFNCQVVTTNPNKMISLKCINKDDYTVDVQTPFTQPVVQFFIPSAGVIYTTEITFQNKTIGLMNEFFIEKKLEVFKDMFYVQAIETTNETKRQQLEEASKGLDSVIYRLTVKTPLQTFTYQFSYPSFDYSQSIYIYQCLDNKQCIEDLATIVNTRKESTYYFDLSTFRGTENLAYIGEPLTLSLSCFRRLLIQIASPTQLCAVLEKSPAFETSSNCLLFKQGQVTFTGKAIDSSDYSYRGFSETDTGNFEFDSPRLCFNCIGCEKNVADMRKASVNMQLTIESDGVLFTIMGNQVVMAEYQNVKIVVFVISSAVLVGLIIDSIMKMIIFGRVIKEARKSRKR